MEYEDDYSYSEDDQYSNYDNYSFYSDDCQEEHQTTSSFSEEQIASFDNLLQSHFSQYTPEEISAYIRSLETTTLINLIQNSTVPHLIKSSINFLQTELDQFFQSEKEGTNTFDITIPKTQSPATIPSLQKKQNPNLQFLVKLSHLSTLITRHPQLLRSLN